MQAPPGVSIIAHPDARWTKPFGWWSAKEQKIEIWPCAWIPTWFGLREGAAALTRQHEILHAWGNPGCNHPWCLGYEGPTWKEWLVIPIQALAGFRFCKECLSHLPKEQYDGQ